MSLILINFRKVKKSTDEDSSSPCFSHDTTLNISDPVLNTGNTKIILTMIIFYLFIYLLFDLLSVYSKRFSTEV